MRKTILWLLYAVITFTLAGCAAPDVVIKSTTLGGDRGIRATGKDRTFDINGVNEGDTLIVAPGSQRAVVPSSPVVINLMESFDFSRVQAEEEKKRDLAVNRKPGARIEFVRGQRDKERFERFVRVRRDDPETQEFNVEVFAANRSEEAFRGDLVIYDWLPSELTLLSTSSVEKYDTREGLKTAISAIPIFGLIAFGIDSWVKTGDVLSVQVEELDQIKKYTIKRLVLEPGQWIGFSQKLRYKLPDEEELQDLRTDTYQRMTQRR